MTSPPDNDLFTAPYSGLSVNSAKRFVIGQLREAGLDSPDLDARLLVMAATGFSHADMIARGTDLLSTEALELMSDYTERRLAGEPVDNILGSREFYGRSFKINKDVLSPRPETEMLVDAALEILKETPDARILDLGTGSGAIIISCLAEAAHAEGVAVDMSPEALTIAEQNAKTHGVADRLTFLCGSWFEPVTGVFDIILSNPPYITDEAMTALDIEVAKFDPELALRGGADGLTAYRAIISEAEAYLKPGGSLLLEIGYDQGQTVFNILQALPYEDVSIHRDLSGHERMIKALLKS
ncbi:peptide chain release factor N(5)-glutamine methyltransferase [Hellea sp.]|nr:peptide chain release factor N(5)-glutamine methyltransferase [Hellea sp.]